MAWLRPDRRAALAVIEPGETVEIGAEGSIGPASKACEWARGAAVAAATSAATLGMFSAVTNPRRVSVVLTDRNLLILEVDGVKTYQVKVLARIPRADLRATPTRAFPSLASKSYVLSGPDGAGIARLTFTLSEREPGQRIADALGAVSS